MLSDVLGFMAKARVFDLAQPMHNDMPKWPNHPPFFMSPYRRHGDVHLGCGYSSSNEVIVMSGHTGTHMDALGHVSEYGHLHGEIQSTTAGNHQGMKTHSIDSAMPLVGRGVLLDIAALKGLDVLRPAQPVTDDDLLAAARRQGVTLREDDIVLVRSGWGAFWDNKDRYLSPEGLPGPDSSAAEFLVRHGVRATGGDTFPYEVVPPTLTELPVHMILLVRNGIHILENLYLEELAGAHVSEFLFIATPLKVVGGTASPIRPLAIV